MQLSENDSLELKSLGTAVDIEENKLVIDMITNLTICKEFYNTIYSTVVDNLCEFPAYCPMTKRVAIESGMGINCWTFLDSQEITLVKKLIELTIIFFSR